MLEFYIAGQSMKMYSPVIAADSLNYLTARFNFTGSEWEGYTRWAHFRKGETVYDIALDENDTITEDKALNLTSGEWDIYLTGTKGNARLTSTVVIVTVKESGLIDAPLHVIPQSVAEQIDAKAAQALLTAQAVKEAADAGKFDGKSFQILGYYKSAAALAEAVLEPEAGSAYGVGTGAPYDVYIWDAAHEAWINNGPLQGAKGDTGTTYTPHVDANGNLAWTNDGGKENPQTQNIRGPKGDTGAAGEAGKSAYAAAVEAGYTGTEATFYAALTAMPYHNARHLPDGADPITVKAGNIDESAVETAKIKAKAVTADKVADAARTQRISISVGTEWTGESAPYTQTVAAAGLLADDVPRMYYSPPSDVDDVDDTREAYTCCYRLEVTGAGGIKLYAKEKPEKSFTATLEVSRI